MHSDVIISKLDPDMQAIIKIVIWRDRVPLYPEEAEIEDASKINIDWLIDMKELDIENEDNKSIAIDDVSITLFSDYSFFSITATRFSQEDNIIGYENQPVALLDSDEPTNIRLTPITLRKILLMRKHRVVKASEDMMSPRC